MSTDDHEKLQENITCGHCSMKIDDTDDAACNHECFLDCERLNLSEDGILTRIEPKMEVEYLPEVEVSGVPIPAAGQTEDQYKRTVVQWNHKAINTLITAYDSRNEEERSELTKERILWITLTNDLAKQGIRTTPQQLKWKWFYLKRKYHESVDRIHRTGTGRIRFRYFDSMDKIFGKSMNSTYSACLTCKNINYVSKSCILNKSDQRTIAEASAVPSTNTTLPMNSRRKIKKEKQEEPHLFRSNETDIKSAELDILRESLELKKRHLEIMERTLEIREREATRKLTRHKDIMAMEEKKLNILAKILCKK